MEYRRRSDSKSYACCERLLALLLLLALTPFLLLLSLLVLVLDELSQLWNILKGDMRFVGPRPLPASDQARYTQPCHRLRLQGKPGLTGLWQVSGRNARTFDEMCLLDTYYLRNRSPALDLLILCRTFAVPLKGCR